MEGPARMHTPETSHERIRVSVANLAQSLRVEETGEQHYFGILNPGKVLRGERLFQPLGGGAELTTQAKESLEKQGALFEAGMDARFSIPTEHFEDIYAQFAQEDNNFFERDIERELREELCEAEIHGASPVLSNEDASRIHTQYLGAVSQVPVDQKNDTSGNATAIPTRRLFHLFELIVPRVVFEKMKQSHALHFYSAEELSKIKQSGIAEMVVTTDGGRISNNTIVTGTFL